ncbi:hypothetical protein [Bradyrhizobium sp. SZCCHNRI1009]|uniref:hypothetical protein n=1 Tax=Bradyrhizobium sp. SZCCHNRI1009 TaxID=3057277 RepID=UPI002916A684|nr:hypothetical protein [Bradyrhizobium sp. SZCCHNRI1009]
MAEKPKTSPYRGSNKHKNRPANGRKGTLCPEWTHKTPDGGYGNDPFNHNWLKTVAHQLFEESKPDPDGSGKRYATLRGIAFASQKTDDGTWHGYPEPWNKVPSELKDNWLQQGKVTKRELKRYSGVSEQNVSWALDSDDE